MRDMADFWVGMDPQARAVVQGVALAALLQAYKGLSRRVSWLPPLYRAEPRLKLAVVAAAALLVTAGTVPAEEGVAAVAVAWLTQLGTSVLGHQTLKQFLNVPMAESRAESEDA